MKMAGRVGFATLAMTFVSACTSVPPVVQPQSDIRAASTTAWCPSIPDGRRTKYTCSYNTYIFSYHGDGVHNANASNVKVQFVFDPSASDVEMIIQGRGQGIDYALTIEWMEAFYFDAAGIERKLGPRIVPSPNYFICRTDGEGFSGTRRIQRALAVDALERARDGIWLTIDPYLKTGIPGAGC